MEMNYVGMKTFCYALRCGVKKMFLFKQWLKERLHEEPLQSQM